MDKEERTELKLLEKNILNSYRPQHQIFMQNIFNFILNLYDKDNKKININLDDEIIEKTLIK